MTENLGQIASRLKELREVCDLSQADVAKKLEVDLETYIKYEDSKLDIPISVLYEATKLFDVDLTELLTGISPKLHNYCFVKKGEGVKIERFKGYNYQSLAFNFIDKKVEPLLVTVEPDDHKKAVLVTHPGQEFNYVVKGSVKLILGNTVFDMSEGDSIYFDPTIPHGQSANNNETAMFLTVILHGA